MVEAGKAMARLASFVKTNLILAGFLGLIKRLVGFFNQLERLKRIFGEDGYADTDCNGQILIINPKTRIPDRPADTFSDKTRLLPVRFRKDNGYFFPAVAADKINLAHCIAYSPGYLAEYRIPYQMAVTVIIFLEIIHIQH